MLGQGAPQSQALGQLGSDYINTTAAKTGSWGTIYCVTTCAFTTLTSGNGPDGKVLMSGTLASITLIAGQILFGYWTAITLSSGSIIAYKV